MTGREIMLYILEHDLYDVNVFEDLRYLGLYTIEQAAVKLETGVESIKSLCMLNLIETKVISGTTYICIKEWQKLYSAV